MVWARVGGDFGHWGGKEVAMQLKEVQAFLKWEQTTDSCKAELVKLQCAGPQRIKAAFGMDQPQTHLLGKPDGVVISKFNLGTKHRSTTNDRSAERFCVPHGVVLERGDVNDVNDAPVVVRASKLNGSTEIENEIDGTHCENLETPMGQSAAGEEIAKDFGKEHGVFVGAVREYKEDEDDDDVEAGLCYVCRA
jgi:hypothetical protein